MLNCRACLWRCIQALDVPTANAQRLSRDVNPLAGPGQLRSFSTRYRPSTTDDGPLDDFEGDSRSQRRKDAWRDSPVAANQKRRERTALRQTPSRLSDGTPNLAKLGSRDPLIPESDWNRRKRELRYLQDPMELATFVQKELGKGKVEEMLQLVRMASQSMECVVSWNHVIDHYLVKERVNDALKVYNDMKKRAQFPDSYTYTILLRGLSTNAHLSGVLSKALSVYHSLYAPNSRVEPSIIHTNAALRVCARAMDMDALWGVAGKIPESGPAAANARTYLTILNAMRQNLLLNAPQGETEDQAAARKERGIMEGRRVWEGIIAKWRSADLVVDEELVCAMARLLLIGSRPRDWDDVLSLVEQTMDIPRLVPRLGTSDRQNAGLQRLRANGVPQQYRIDDDHLSPGNAPMRGDEFLALTPQGVGSAISNPLLYARPGNNTLSVVQEACQKIVANKASEEYWDLLTDPTTYNVVPDLNNLHTRLRNLRQNRASSAALQLLQLDMVEKGVQPRPGTIRIAMSTCVRDKNNHNSFRNAGHILKIMSKTLEDNDPKTVTMYAELVLSFPLATGSDYVDALTLLNPMIRNIRLQLGIGGRERLRGHGATYVDGQERQDAITALRKVYGVFDKLLFSNMIAEEQKTPFKAERARLGSFLNRMSFKYNDGATSRTDDDSKPLEGEADLHGYLRDEGEEETAASGGRNKRFGTRPAHKEGIRPPEERPLRKRDGSPNLDARGALPDM